MSSCTVNGNNAATSHRFTQTLSAPAVNRKPLRREEAHRHIKPRKLKDGGVFMCAKRPAVTEVPCDRREIL